MTDREIELNEITTALVADPETNYREILALLPRRPHTPPPEESR